MCLLFSVVETEWGEGLIVNLLRKVIGRIRVIVEYHLTECCR